MSHESPQGLGLGYLSLFHARDSEEGRFACQKSTIRSSMWCIPCIPYLPHPRPKISVHVEELRVQSHNLGPHLLGPSFVLLLVINVIVQILLLILLILVDVIIGVVNIVLGSSYQALLVVVAPQTSAPLGVSIFASFLREIMSSRL